MKSILKISSLLSALVLAGCATAPQENVDAAAPGKVQVECGVNSPPGCRPPPVPAVFVKWEDKVQTETTTADVLRQRAVDAMANLPAKQRIEASESFYLVRGAGADQHPDAVMFATWLVEQAHRFK